MKPCRQRGCPALTLDDSGLCLAHKRQAQQQQDAERGSSTERGYDRRWSEYSRQYRAVNPFCVKCGAPATDVDHIVACKPGAPLFWDPANHQSLCHACHSRKTATENGAFGHRKQRVGYPGQISTGVNL